MKNETAPLDDFRTMQDPGFPLENEAPEREGAEGLSAYNARDYAIKRARATNVLQGESVVPVRIPDEREIEFRQTFRNRRHFTIYPHGAQALALVCGAAVSAREQDHD